jgi:hypothetical protein
MDSLLRRHLPKAPLLAEESYEARYETCWRADMDPGSFERENDPQRQNTRGKSCSSEKGGEEGNTQVGLLSIGASRLQFFPP